jgi:hypothetical protein
MRRRRRRRRRRTITTKADFSRDGLGLGLVLVLPVCEWISTHDRMTCSWCSSSKRTRARGDPTRNGCDDSNRGSSEHRI